MMNTFPISVLEQEETPFYYYDLALLRKTLQEIKRNINGCPYCVHYAVKANANLRILREIAEAGLGADCVSGGELRESLKAGFPGGKIAFAGVGKTDKEINAGLDADIFCFNAESQPELEAINRLAGEKGKKANVAIRVNPNVDAHTHKYITTGLSENKFGINLEKIESVVAEACELENINFIGLHFHIGSQITEMGPFVALCDKINELQDQMEKLGVELKVINVGGGLGIDYNNPDANLVPDFKGYFEVFKKHLKLRDGQELHFELGRSVVAQCGSLITRVTYVKEGTVKKFVIADAGMSDLIRPALYQAHHKIENISSKSGSTDVYDVVGPICESSDCFGTDERLSLTKRGDLLALRSAGAYGEIMALRYNCRELPGTVYSE